MNAFLPVSPEIPLEQYTRGSAGRGKMLRVSYRSLHLDYEEEMCFLSGRFPVSGIPGPCRRQKKLYIYNVCQFPD